jgi:hypothetical protein
VQLAPERREPAIARHEHERRDSRTRVREIEGVDDELDVGGVPLGRGVVGEDLARLDAVLGHLSPERAHELQAPVRVGAAHREVADQAGVVSAELGDDVVERQLRRGLLPARGLAEQVLDVEQHDGVEVRHPTTIAKTAR